MDKWFDNKENKYRPRKGSIDYLEYLEAREAEEAKEKKELEIPDEDLILYKIRDILKKIYLWIKYL